MAKKQRRRNLKVVIIALAAIFVLGMSAVTAATLYSGAQTASANFGGLGSAHEHAAFVVRVDGKQINFAQQKYQVMSPYIHVENGIGTTLHKHALNVPFGEFLKSVGMGIVNGCFEMDDGKKYCDNGSQKLRFFINGAEKPATSITSYVLKDNDRFLVIFGGENDQEIHNELSKLDLIAISRT